MTRFSSVFLLLAVVSFTRAAELDMEVTEPSVSTTAHSIEINQSRRIDLVVGNSYVISCASRSGGFGQLMQVWFKEGVATQVILPGSEPLDNMPAVYSISRGTNQWNLVLNQYEASATGTYSCRGVGAGNEAMLIIGMSNPIVIARIPDLSLNAGSQGFVIPGLFAFVSGNPQPTTAQITWVVNGITSEVTGRDFRLGNNIVESDAGVYTCTVTTSAGAVSVNFSVTVNIQPEVAISPLGKQILRAGSTFSLMCTDSVGRPAPVFQWSKDNQPLAVDDSRVQVTSAPGTTSSSLEISSLERGDAGLYDCTGENQAGTSTQYIQLEVLFVPELSSVSTRTTWVVGETLLIRAILTAANPIMFNMVVWRKGNMVLTDTPRLTISRNFTDFSMSVDDLVVGDEGHYTLEVTNEIGPGIIGFDIVVESPPTLSHSNNMDTIYIRNNAQSVPLPLTISGAKPSVVAPQVTWSVLESGDTVIRPIDLSRMRYSSSLTGESGLSLSIADPVLADSGLYTVTIMHSAGNASLGIQLVVLDPPNPPTNISATSLSSCMANVQWNSPTRGPDTTAPADYIIIESLVSGESVWVELGRMVGGVTSLDVRLPGSGPDTMYQLRGRSGSDKAGVGEGMVFTSPETFMAYPRGDFPPVQDLTGRPASPSSIRLSWSLPEQNCFSFLAQTLSCSREGRSPSTTLVSDPTQLNGLVEGLDIDSLYNCTVESILTDLERRSFNHTAMAVPRLTFTYPDYPPVPETPKVNVSTPTTIVVNFMLPDNYQDISHYQVIVLRLRSVNDLPTMHPDQLYGPDYEFDTYTDVHGPDSPKRTSFKPYIASEISGESFNPVFVLGSGLRTNSSNRVYLNDKLEPGSAYSCFLRAFPKTFYDRPFRRRKRLTNVMRQYDIFSSSGFLSVQKTEPIPPPTEPLQEDTQLGLIVGVSVAALLVLCVCITIVLVAICCLRMRRNRRFKPGHMAEVDNSNSTSPDGTPGYVNTPDLGRKTNGIELKRIDMINPAPNGTMYEPSGPTSVEDFSTHVEKFDANRQLLFQEEFEWITTNSPWHPAESSNHPLNDEKNRYHNITAFDHTRVKLSPEHGVECSDYINANYIIGYSGDNEYIATQGPLEQTVVEFWKMVWEQNTHTIVMLTNLVELGKVKCTQYWPINGTVIYGGVKVTLEHIVELPDYTIRNLNVSSMVSGDSRIVLQFHYTRWPDYGVPKLAAPLLNFLRAVNVSNPPAAGPALIHCSAGVGRSGTVITIDYCLRQLKAEGFMNPCGFVTQMRNQRNYMVQTEQQYTFIHYALLEAITYGDTSFELSTFSDSYQSLQEVNPVTGRTLLDEEFGRMGTVKTMTKKSSFQQKIRQKGAPQRHFNSSFMGSLSGSGSGTLDLFSAHYIDTYSDTRKIIVADGPMEETAAKWWQMVWDEDASYIVMLTPQDDEDTFVYWSGEGDTVRHGNIIVEIENESAEHLYTCRKIKLTNAKVEGISHTVHQWQFIGWTSQYLPRVPDFVGFVCDIMKGVDSLKKHQRVLIHDIDSLGPSGVLCSLYYCIERLQTERMVDVFQSVQTMKLQRPGSVKTVSEYAFLYDCVYEFIRTHSNTDTA